MKKLIARHKWVLHATISELYDTENDGKRSFVATVHGWRGFHIPSTDTEEIIRYVKSIRDRIEKEDSSVFCDKKYLKS